MKPGDWVRVVRPEYDIPALLRPNNVPTTGRVDEVTPELTIIIFVPIGGADVDVHSQAVPYPPEALEPAVAP